MPNLVTFEQLFDIFLGRLGMQVNNVKTDLVATVRNTRSYLFHNISCFIPTVNSVIHQYFSS